MQAHYGAHCPDRESIVESLKARPQGARVLLALDNEKVVGLACFRALFPGPGLTTGFFLKGFYVRQHRRGRGLGRKLMALIARAL